MQISNKMDKVWVVELAKVFKYVTNSIVILISSICFIVKGFTWFVSNIGSVEAESLPIKLRFPEEICWNKMDYFSHSK